MAVRGWGGSIAAAIGIAAGAGAAQLGFGYGLGIMSWLPAADRAGEAAWAASLAWAAWIAATSTVAGAIGAARLARAGDRPDADGRSGAALLSRLSLAAASAVGGLVTVVLVAVPARAAVRADTFSPQTIAAGYAVFGVIIGLIFAMWALSSEAVAANVIATIGWLWLLAVTAVIDAVVSGRGLTTAQLGVWQITSDSERFWFRDYFYWPGAALSLASAFVIGVLAARIPARDPRRRVGTAVSGMAGPLVVAAAYFLAAPRLVGIRAEQLSAHLLAPYAVLAGLAGSVLMTTLVQRAEDRRPAAAGAPAVVPGQRQREPDLDRTAHLYGGADRDVDDSAHRFGDIGADRDDDDSAHRFGDDREGDFAGVQRFGDEREPDDLDHEGDRRWAGAAPDPGRGPDLPRDHATVAAPRWPDAAAEPRPAGRSKRGRLFGRKG
jgi:hypothetical protein